MKTRQALISVTVGIPAYNEGQNIGNLLKSILRQKTRRSRLKEIIVISDGSTDNTVEEVKKINDKRLFLIAHKKRIGQNSVQNEIMRRATSDILILLNSDVLPVGLTFIDTVITPFLTDKKVGVVGVQTISAKPQTFIERILVDSHTFKTAMYKQIENGNNIYMCYGAARAFRKDLYKKLRWPKSIPEDSYTYLFAIKSGFHFRYEPSAKVVFRLPSTLHDHIKQSSRFSGGKRALEKIFSKETVQKEFSIPVSVALRTFFVLLPKSRLSLPSYVLIHAYASILSRGVRKYNDKHDISVSTKRIISMNVISSLMMEKL